MSRCTGEELSASQRLVRSLNLGKRSSHEERLVFAGESLAPPPMDPGFACSQKIILVIGDILLCLWDNRSMHHHNLFWAKVELAERLQSDPFPLTHNRYARPPPRTSIVACSVGCRCDP